LEGNAAFPLNNQPIPLEDKSSHFPNTKPKSLSVNQLWFETVAPYFAAATHVMHTNAVLVFGILTTLAVTLFAFIASHKGHPIIAALLAAAAWLFVGLNVLIWLWVR
jgi:hypothetical protein